MSDKVALAKVDAKKVTISKETLAEAFAEALAKCGLTEQLMELDHRMREQADAHHRLMALSAKVDETFNRLENVHRDHMGVMLDVQRQQQSRAALEERARQQGYLDNMGYERNAAWGMARLEAGLCGGTSKDMQRCTLKAKHDGDCVFPEADPNDPVAAKDGRVSTGAPPWSYR